MPHKFKYDWTKIQEYYDQGHSIRECENEFGFGSTARIKAVKAGRFTPRLHQDACDLKRKREKPKPTGERCSHTSWKGEIACAKFEVRALEKDVIISRPSVECAYDRVADVAGTLCRVQIKYAGQEKNGVIFGALSKTCRNRTCKIAYAEDEIDVIVLYSPSLGKLFWLPKEVWKGKIGITLRYQEKKNGHKNGGIRAEDYEW